MSGARHRPPDRLLHGGDDRARPVCDRRALRAASFHAVGANAYMLSGDHTIWRTYRELLEHLSRLFDGGALPPPPITTLGKLSPDVVKQAHALLESNAVQGKLVMTC